MKQVLMCLLFWAHSICPAAEEPQPQKIVIAYEDWPPSTMMVTENNKKRGFVVDIMVDIFSSHGYIVELREYPYLRAIKELEAGNIHILAETIEGIPTTAGLKFPRQPTFQYRYSFFMSDKKNWRYQGTESLNNLRIATIAGYDYSNMDQGFGAYINKNRHKNVTTVTGEKAVERIFQMMDLDRIDLFCEAEVVGKYLIAQQKSQVNIHAVGHLQKPLILKPAFSPKDPRGDTLIQLWDQERKKLNETGKINHYLSKYNIASNNESIQ